VACVYLDAHPSVCRSVASRRLPVAAAQTAKLNHYPTPHVTPAADILNTSAIETSRKSADVAQNYDLPS
jgi:hypothetical protein